jgi:antitoxin HicB
MKMAVSYRYSRERQDNGWWLVRFADVPEALTEGETEAEAHAAAVDCLVAALEGYVKAGRPVPRPAAASDGEQRAVLPSLVTAKLAVHETMRAQGRSRPVLARQLGITEIALRRLLELRHHSDIRAIDRALAAMNAELAIELPDFGPGRRAA